MSSNNNDSITLNEDDTPFLEVEDLHKRFGGVHALKGVSFCIEKGQIYHLLGENGCGKSTLIKAIAGAHKPSSGKIFVKGVEQKSFGPIQALASGIETVYQDLSLLPNLSVAENIGLTQQLVRSKGNLYRLLDREKVRSTAIKALKVVGLPIDSGFLSTVVSRLPIAIRQLVAISRAIAGDAGLVIMDEPTTSLTRSEVDNLIGVVRRLQQQGVSVLFVTHKLDECKAIGGNALVMRDGELITACGINEISKQEISYLMTGRKLKQGRYRHQEITGNPLLELKHLNHSSSFCDINLTLFRGEILGITGLLDSGRNELAKAIAGIESIVSGEICIDSRKVKIDHPNDSIEAGIGYVPEDRIHEGLFIEKSILDNTVLGVLKRLKNKLGFIDTGKAKKESNRIVSELQIVAPDVSAPVQSLSGGNQQRVLIGRWLATKPDILVLHGPTVGVDVGSKDTIYQIIQKEANSGKGIILISDDLPELLQNCDRIALMFKGRITSVLSVDGLTEELLYDHISGGAGTQGEVPA